AHTSATTSRYRASSAITRECRRQCMITYGQPASATTLVMVGSASPPETSLTTTAPAASAAAATAARVVSTLTGTPAAANSVITGTTRRISVAASTRSAPGRVDSPPTSIRSAPCARSSIPCAIAASRLAHRPPSENESGVTLRTPITTGPGPITNCPTGKPYYAGRSHPACAPPPARSTTAPTESVGGRSAGGATGRGRVTGRPTGRSE